MQIGVNLPWFNGAYGHDLGPNQAHPTWPVSFCLSEAERIFDAIEAFDIKLLRIWLFEQAEGLNYDANCLVRGVDTIFLRNLESLVCLLKRRGFLVYWTLLDGNSVFRNADTTTFRILTDVRAAEAFCLNALMRTLPLLKDTIWAIDLCNEPEAAIRGHFGNRTQVGADWEQILPSLAALSQAARCIPARVPVSVGSGYTEHINLRDNPLFFHFCESLDFIDYHTYKAGSAVMHRLSCVNESTKGMPWILGEVGCEVREQDRRSLEAWRRAQKHLSRKLHRLSDFQYDAVFLWYASYPEIEDATSLLFSCEAGDALLTALELRRAGDAAKVHSAIPIRAR